MGIRGVIVELPGARDIERVKNLLQSTAQLEFWETESKDKLTSFLFQANELLKQTVVQDTAEKSLDDNSEIDDLLADIEAQQDSVSVVQNPIFDIVVDIDFPGPVVVRIAEKDKGIFDSYLQRSDVRNLLPAELRFTKFLWSKSDPNSELIDLYAIRSNRTNTPPLGGSVIVDARSTYDQFNSPAVSMQMNAKGARTWEEMTGKAFRENGNIAIVLDNLVYSAPGVSKVPFQVGVLKSLVSLQSMKQPTWPTYCVLVNSQLQLKLSNLKSLAHLWVPKLLKVESTPL